MTLQSQLVKKNNQLGFTLIELLIVIALIGVLATVTLVSLNPAKQFQTTRNTQRKNDIAAILTAVNSYASDNRGQLPSAITTSPQTIANTGADICAFLVPKYLPSLPKDPVGSTTYTSCTSYNTGYVISKSPQYNRVTVTAPSAEGGETITFTR